MTDAQRKRYEAALESLRSPQRTVNDIINGYPEPEVAGDFRMIFEMEDLTRRLDALTTFVAGIPA